MTRRILLVVEGEKQERRLFKQIFKTFDFGCDYEIFSYRTNIHELYERMFCGPDADPENSSFLGILKERASEEDRSMLDLDFSDVILAFDYDPQDNRFDADGLMRMQEYFCESTDEGKLYLNYPMVEACKHFGRMPDFGYLERKVGLEEVARYKETVGNESRCQNFERDFSLDVMKHAVALTAIKACSMAGLPCDVGSCSDAYGRLDLRDVLTKQNELLARRGSIAVLGTCLLFVCDYSLELAGLRETLASYNDNDDGARRLAP